MTDAFHRSNFGRFLPLISFEYIKQKTKKGGFPNVLNYLGTFFYRLCYLEMYDYPPVDGDDCQAVDGDHPE